MKVSTEFNVHVKPEAEYTTTVNDFTHEQNNNLNFVSCKLGPEDNKTTLFIPRTVEECERLIVALETTTAKLKAVATAIYCGTTAGDNATRDAQAGDDERPATDPDVYPEGEF